MTVLIHDSEAAFYAERLSQEVPGLSYTAAPALTDAMAAAPEAEVLVGLAPYLPPELIAAMPRLRWIQALTAGVDNLRGLSGIAITNAGGFHGPQMSELAVMLTTAVLRNFPRMIDNQRAGQWERWKQPLLWRKTACIIGVGAIAEYLARVLQAFEMTVTGVTSRADAPGFDRLYPRAQLADAVAGADIVYVLTPYTPANHHVVDAGVVAAMKPSALLINLARGGCVDEAAVADALRTGRIAGAAFDVFAGSPLPPDSPMWRLPNMICTSHIGGFADVYHEQALPILVANMKAYAEGGVDALAERLDT